MFITLSGMPCSGKSSVAKYLEQKYNFQIISSGQIFRDEAVRRNMSLLDFSELCNHDSSIDIELDQKMTELGKEYAGQKVIFDSRMAWHFIPNSFKVYVTLTPEIMAQRLFDSDRNRTEKGATKEEAQQQLMARWKSENYRYSKYYGLDNTDENNFDLVISSANKTIEQLAEEIYSKYRNFYKIKE